MGDIADDLIDQMIERGCRNAYGPPLQCRYCGATGLYWQKVRGRHLIYERETLEPHHCKPTADGLENLDA
jgi:hypothetical protein